MLSPLEGKKSKTRKQLSMLRNRKTRSAPSTRHRHGFFWKIHVDPDFSVITYYYLLVIKNYIWDPYFLGTDVDTIKATKFVFVPLKKRVLPFLKKKQLVNTDVITT